MEEIDISKFQEAPAWSVFLGDGMGRWLVLASFALFLLSALAWAFVPKNQRLEKVGKWAFTLGCTTVLGAFAALAVLFINDRFEYQYVWGHTDSLNSLQYKISAIWAGQEGSFMLWAAASAIFGLLTVKGTGLYRRWFTFIYALFLMGICGIMAYESAFKLIDPVQGKYLVPLEGNGLAPSLLNYWITIHPPTIFLGFGSLTVLFAYGVAALIVGNPLEWVPRARPWSIVSLTLIGVGLCMGGFWAYETLGWGGFWMWDPVENTSFVPWVFMALLVHGFLVQQARKKWFIGNMALAGLPFFTFLYGTFLTRSGFLGDTSVHSFAQMDNKALYLLIGMFVTFTVGFIALLLLRAKPILKAYPPADRAEPNGLTREKVYLWGNIALASFAIATAIGMSVPFFQAMAKQPQKVVEEALYHKVLVWPFFPVMLIMAIAPFVSWRGTSTKELTNKLYLVLCCSIFLTGMTLVAMKMETAGMEVNFGQSISILGMNASAMFWTMILAGLCYFVIVAHSIRAIEMLRKNRTSVASFMTHVGFAVTLCGLVVSRGLEDKRQILTQEGVPVQALGYTINYLDMGNIRDRNNKVRFQVFNDKESFVATPSFYLREGENRETGMPEDQPFVWPFIRRGVLHDFYFTLHPSFTDASNEITLKPGESATVERFEVRYIDLKRQGNPGQPGTKFAAELQFKLKDGQVIDAAPSLEIGEGGLKQNAAQIDADYEVRMLPKMDVATKSVTIQLHYVKPVWPIEIFYKPFVGLVWIGTGIMALAGFFAAWNRRSRRATPPADSTKEEIESSSETEPTEDALKSLA